MIKKIWNIVERIMYWGAYHFLHLKISEQSWRKWCQFVKFGIVGFSNTVIYYIAYLILLQFSISYLAASILAYLISILNAYYWNSRYVFSETYINKSERWKTLIKTFLSYASTGLILNNLLLILWIDRIGIPEVLAPLLNLCITIPVNFYLNKIWAFK